jgi:hypothetical protein
MARLASEGGKRQAFANSSSISDPIDLPGSDSCSVFFP